MTRQVPPQALDRNRSRIGSMQKTPRGAWRLPWCGRSASCASLHTYPILIGPSTPVKVPRPGRRRFPRLRIADLCSQWPDHRPIRISEAVDDRSQGAGPCYRVPVPRRSPVRQLDSTSASVFRIVLTNIVVLPATVPHRTRALDFACLATDRCNMDIYTVIVKALNVDRQTHPRLTSPSRSSCGRSLRAGLSYSVPRLAKPSLGPAGFHPIAGSLRPHDAFDTPSPPASSRAHPLAGLPPVRRRTIPGTEATEIDHRPNPPRTIGNGLVVRIEHPTLPRRRRLAHRFRARGVAGRRSP